MKKISIAFLSLMLFFTSFTSLRAKDIKEITNLVHGKTYEISTKPREIWEDTDNKELTDGKFAPELFTDERWQGHHKSDQADLKRTITFDLGEKKSIKRIKSNYLHDPETGIRLPKFVKYRVSNDNKNWKEIASIRPKTHLGYELKSRETIYWDGEQEGIFDSKSSFDSVYAQFIQVEFLIDSPWVFIDEVEILGHQGIGVNTLTLESETKDKVQSKKLTPIHDLEGMDNYSKSKEYKINNIKQDSKLTDGIFGSRNDEENWKFINTENGLELVIDLSSENKIAFIEARFIEGFGMVHPDKISIEISKDKENWANLAELYNKYPHQSPENSIQSFTWDGRFDGFKGSNEKINKVNARYVKLKIDSTSSIGIDEILVLGSDENFGETIDLKPDDFDPSLELPEGADYLRKSDELKNINDIVLLYNHVNAKWDEDKLLPYLSYINKNQELESRFFDTVLYLGLRTPGGNTFDTNTEKPSNLEDWKWYLNRTFREGGDMDKLNEASKIVEEKLQDGYKQKVFLMIPYPSTHQKNFGELSGQNLNFDPKIVGNEESLENRKMAMQWYINKANDLMNEKKYEYLDFVGFYWVAENIESSIANEEILVRNVNEMVHEKDLLNFWIPYFKASGFNKWKEYGFDFAIMQPNFYFEQYSKESRLEETSILARKYGMGVEIEFDERLIVEKEDSESKREKFLDYLRYGEKYKFNGDVIRAYYQGGNTLEALSKHDDSQFRSYYDKLYSFLQHPEETPTDPEETPTSPEETPTDPEENPTDPEETPTNPEETPTDPEETPTESDEKPIETEKNPSNDGDNNKLPETGISSSLGLSLSLIAGGSILIFLKKRRK